MNKNLLNDLNNLNHLLQEAATQSSDYLADIHNRKTSLKIRKRPNSSLSNEGLGANKALHLFKDRFEPLIVSSSGPRYWGFVTGGSTPASILGDWLASVYDQNTQTISGDGDISANIEVDTISLLLELFNLPKADYFGGFVTGATMSNFTCLAVARQWYGKKKNTDFAKNGVNGKINILSTTPHSSSVKSLSMLGVGSSNIIKVKEVEGNREAMCLTNLQHKLKELEGEPAIIIASGGTVNTVDFDDFTGILSLKKKYNFWLHIDAAFGGFAACSEKYSHFLTNWDKADSITVDCHKWLNVPYESGVFFIKEDYKLLQTETFQNSNAPYLGDPKKELNYLNLLPENSRRLKALPAWFTLQAYGKEGYKYIVENCISLAKDLGYRIERNNFLTLLAPVRLNTVCFTLKNSNSDTEVIDFLNALNAKGKVFMSPTHYYGKQGIRCSFVNWRTTKKDLDIAFAEIEKLLKEMHLSNKN